MICVSASLASACGKAVRPVKYVDVIPSINVLPFVLDGNAEQALDLVFTKSTVWDYEREWRVIHNQAGTLHRYLLHALKTVYFGISIVLDILDSVKRAARVANPSVQLWQRKQNYDNFTIDFTEVT
jgi:hypothetical protein